MHVITKKKLSAIGLENKANICIDSIGWDFKSEYTKQSNTTVSGSQGSCFNSEIAIFQWLILH